MKDFNKIIKSFYEPKIINSIYNLEKKKKRMVLTVVDRIDNYKEFLTINFEQIDVYLFLYIIKIFFYLTIITGHFA
jgi:hypothetical protein